MLIRGLVEASGLRVALLCDWWCVRGSFRRGPYLLCLQELRGRRETVLAAPLWEVLPRSVHTEVPPHGHAEQGLPMLPAHMHDLPCC